MARKKKEEQDIPTEQEISVSISEDLSKDTLEFRQKELLDLLDAMHRNGFHDTGNIEQALSVVNRDLSAIKK